MPQYKVIARGFFGGHMYDPEGKRHTLHTNKPFKKGEMPSWVEAMKSESEAVRKKREKQESSAKTASDQKAEQDQKDISGASFMGAGENVTTL